MISQKWRTLVLTSIVALSSAAHAEGFWKFQDLYAENTQKDIFSHKYSYNNAVRPEKLGGVIRIKFQDARDVPQIFRQFLPGENFERPRGISVYLSVTNDYNLLNPIAVGAETDDNGYTHGSKVSIGGFLPTGHYLTFDASSDLYTQEIEGSAKQLPDGGRGLDQHFTNENILKFVIDNIDNARSETFYWKAEAGWQQLQSDSRGNVLTAATQQDKFHQMVNNLKPGQTKTPTYVSDGEKTRDGIIMGLYLGIAKEYVNTKNTCRVRAFTELGGRGSTIDGASYVAANVGGVLWCQAGPRTLTYRAEIGHNSKAFPNGYEGSGYVDISTGRKNWRIGFRLEQTHGTLNNYQNYNLINAETGKIDPTFTIYYRHYFQ